MLGQLAQLSRVSISVAAPPTYRRRLANKHININMLPKMSRNRNNRNNNNNSVCSKCCMVGKRGAFQQDSKVCVKCKTLELLENKLSMVEKRLETLEAKHRDRVDTSVQGSGSKIINPPPTRSYAEALVNQTTTLNTTTSNRDQQDDFTPVCKKKSKKKMSKTNDLVIGTSIVRNVIIPKAPLPICLPGARMGDIIGQLKLKKQAGNHYRRIVIHAGGNDARRQRSEVLKLQVHEACELAKSFSDSVIFSGPLPNLSSDENYSRHLSFNRWLSNYTKSNDIGFINNWSSFWGKPHLLNQDHIHPTRDGTIVLTNNIAKCLQPLN